MASCLDAVCETVVHIVDGLPFQRLRFVVTHRSGRNHTGLFAARQRCQIRPIVTLLAVTFRVALRAL
jgi:hypothetical protein